MSAMQPAAPGKRRIAAAILCAGAAYLTAACRQQRPTSVSSAAKPVPFPLEAVYGQVPGHRDLNAEHYYKRDPGYPEGIFAVMLSADKLTAFDTQSTQTGECSRIDPIPVELPNW